MCESADAPVSFPITKIVNETPNIRTFFVKAPICIFPGQFVMVWLPGVDEKPFAIAYLNKQGAGITVQRRGKYTGEKFKLKKDEVIGLRGPYGNGFGIGNVKKALVVSGGCGSASVALLVEALKANKVKTDIVIAAKTKKELLFEKRFSKFGKVHVATDDGSKGHQGFATDVAEKLMKKKKYDMVYSCGPEVMMLKLLGLCKKHKVDCQMSLERYMKCGFGICGQCAIDGWLVCKDGPVFDKKQLLKLKEFGKFYRTKSGKKVSIGKPHTGKC